MNSKVKVNTAQLLAAVRARRAKIESEYERYYKKYERDLEAYPAKVVDALAQALQKAQHGDLPKYEASYNGKRLEVPVRFEKPIEPRKTDLSSIDRLIATLEMAAEDTLSISADDAAQYLG
jgi:hypothetical protein